MATSVKVVHLWAEEEEGGRREAWKEGRVGKSCRSFGAAPLEETDPPPLDGFVQLSKTDRGPARVYSRSLLLDLHNNCFLQRAFY